MGFSLLYLRRVDLEVHLTWIHLHSYVPTVPTYILPRCLLLRMGAADPHVKEILIEMNTDVDNVHFRSSPMPYVLTYLGTI